MRLIRNLLAGGALVLGGVMPVGAMAFPAAPMSVPQVAPSDIVDVAIVCDLTGCYETRRPPPPGYDEPRPRGYDDPPPRGYDDPPPRYRPPPPGYGEMPPPPPPGYRRPPPPPPPGYGTRPSRRHVEWCLDRYRSYDPRSNTYIGRDGRQRTCRSPY